jgi:hypothetical protein
MKNLITLMLKAVAGGVAAYFGRHLWTAAKIEGVKLYLHGVAGARRLFLAMLGLALCLFALCFGIILIHIGILFLLPGDIRIMVVLGLGVFYALSAGGMLIYCCREKTWMQASGAAKAMQSVLQDRR